MDNVTHNIDDTKPATKPRHRFLKGVSGNPNGRPKGSRNRYAQRALSLLDGELEKMTRRCIDLAMNGDIQALKLCIERILPQAKELPVNFTVPALETASDLPKLTSQLIKEVGAGNLLTGQATAISNLVGQHRAALELATIEDRLKALESAQEATKQ